MTRRGFFGVFAGMVGTAVMKPLPTLFKPLCIPYLTDSKAWYMVAGTGKYFTHPEEGYR